VNEQSYPVTVLAKLPDGSTAPVRVGTAVRDGEGFRLSLGDLAIGAVADPAPMRRAAPPSHDEGMVFPPYGRSRGAPIAGASVQDLQFYISGSRRTLDDPAKARWHDKERALLAVMEAELARQTGGGGGGGESSGRSAAPGFDDVPDFTDDDVPF
jgi:hypothetical protein